jgi:hypothetical protein
MARKTLVLPEPEGPNSALKPRPGKRTCRPSAKPGCSNAIVASMASAGTLGVASFIAAAAAG